MINNNDGSVEIILANQLGYERVAMACSASFAQLFGFPKDRIEDLKTVVAEASINAMQHGNKGKIDAKVVVTIGFQNDAIWIWVGDEGDGIKVVSPKPNIDKIIEADETLSGFGLYIIEQLADHVEFKERPERGHIVEIALNMKA
jgi:serine/threonine-protein kinase RsbW